MDKEQFQSFIRMHLLMPWRGAREVKEYKDTWYNAGAWEKRGTVEYSSRRSKLTNKMVSHLEHRITHTRICESFGIFTSTDLLAVNPAEVAARLCRLGVVDWRKYEKNVQRTARNNYQAAMTRSSMFVSPFDYYLGRLRSYPRRLLTEIDADLMTDEGLRQVGVQQLADLRYFAFKGALIRIPFAPFLKDVQLSWVELP